MLVSGSLSMQWWLSNDVYLFSSTDPLMKQNNCRTYMKQPSCSGPHHLIRPICKYPRDWSVMLPSLYMLENLQQVYTACKCFNHLVSHPFCAKDYRQLESLWISMIEWWLIVTDFSSPSHKIKHQKSKFITGTVLFLYMVTGNWGVTLWTCQSKT
jgi:hypothetical protein